MQFIDILPSNSSIKPHPRSGHRAIATESDLWIWGGYYPAEDDQPERMFQEVLQRKYLFLFLINFFVFFLNSFGVIISLFDDGLLSKQQVMDLHVLLRLIQVH
jgi:hypothetical protein